LEFAAASAVYGGSVRTERWRAHGGGGRIDEPSRCCADEVKIAGRYPGLAIVAAGHRAYR
jgi:hypothetical protein